MKKNCCMGTIKRFKGLMIAFALLAVAYWLAAWGRRLDPHGSMLCGTLRAGIHMALVIWWGCSLGQRVLHLAMRRRLVGIAAMMLFWLLVRYIRWTYELPLVIEHGLWYLYYIPIVFIPLLALHTALAVGKNEDHRLPVWTRWCCVLGAVLVLLVLTNDLHHLAFDIDISAAPASDVYTHRIVFYLVVAWCTVCIGGVLVVLFRRSRFLKIGQRMALGMCCVAMAGYTAAYMGGPGYAFVKVYLRDMTVIHCVMTVLMLEICLQTRLIPSNEGYERLFRASRLRAAVYDGSGQMMACSADYIAPTDEYLRKSMDGPVICPDQLRISSAAMTDGRVVCQDDVSDFMEVIEALQEMKEELEGENALSRSEYELQSKHARIMELRRIYDRLGREMSEQVRQLSALLEAYDEASDETERRALLRRAVMLGAYLKRRSNLILLCEGRKELPRTELALCFRESLASVESFGMLTCFQVELPERIPCGCAMRLYDFFEAALEKAVRGARSITAYLRGEDGKFTIIVNTDTADDMTALVCFDGGMASVERDGDEWQLVLETGGEA